MPSLPKKRRTNSNQPQDDSYSTWLWHGDQALQYATISDLERDGTVGSRNEAFNVGTNSADVPRGIRFNGDVTTPLSHISDAPVERVWNNAPTLVAMSTGEQQPVTTMLNWDLGNGSSGHAAAAMDITGSAKDLRPYAKSIQESNVDCEIITTPRKRRRSGCPSTSSSPRSSIALTNRLTSLTNAAFLGGGLLRVYHDSFETHLSCWLTERTCPYDKDCDVSLPGDSGPDWNRIYHRVFKLDQSTFVRGRLVSVSEDRASSRALNLAIFSFASQWARSDAKHGSRYPFRMNDTCGIKSTQRPAPHEASFDLALQLTAWHQARKAIHEAANIESFRVVLAHIVFSLTQKPGGNTERRTEKTYAAQSHHSVKKGLDVDECDLMEELELTLNDDVPPLHLEQGLRLIHLLRSRMTMAGALGGRRNKRPRCWKHLRASELEAADRGTVDLLFWLCIVFDTLSSAMHKRPLVVSLEDSDLPAIESITRDYGSTPRTQRLSDPKTEDLWDELLVGRQHEQSKRPSARWPFSENEAASVLCEAAPIKVLLFRKVTRIQTLLSRHAQSETIEAAVHSALEVYGYWQKTYAPFLRDCIEHHANLTERVQSWHACLAGHWHLATLLLADLLDTIDETGVGCQARRRDRESLNFVTCFREENCRSLSDIAKCACLQQDRIMSRASSDSFFIGHGVLLTEPWSDVLIRAYAMAGATLLQTAAAPTASSAVQHDALKRADDCARALCFLGGRSDKASSAANMLLRELSLRRAGSYEYSTSTMLSAVARAG